MSCGCGYELFWKLNPHKLEPFFETKRKAIKEQMSMYDFLAWMVGACVREAIASTFGKHQYPQQPIGMTRNGTLDGTTDSQKGGMSDGERFALFMVKHNKAIKAKKRQSNNNA